MPRCEFNSFARKIPQCASNAEVGAFFYTRSMLFMDVNLNLINIHYFFEFSDNKIFINTFYIILFYHLLSIRFFE